MSRGKYSPNLPTANKGFEYFNRNAKGDIPPEWSGKGTYDSELHFDNYDPEGYDMYGYSAYDAEGNFVGHGDGVDRNGYTEMEYLCDEDLWESVL